MQNENDLLEELRLKAAALLEADDKSNHADSGGLQHSLMDHEKKDHAAAMARSGITVKFHGDDEMSYHGTKAKVKQAVINHYGGDASAKEDAKELHGHLFEGEELDELSKSTLGSYIGKASAGAVKNALGRETMKAAAADTAVMANKYYDAGMGDRGRAAHDMSLAHAAHGKKLDVKHSKRLDGIAKAVGKLTVSNPMSTVSSGNTQHSLRDSEKPGHAAHMQKTFGVTTKYHGDDELSYHGPKKNVVAAVKNHYDDDREAKYHHSHLFEGEELTKESVQFDISSVFEGEELTEEFKIKMTALFEAAVAQKVSVIEEAYAKALEESEAERAQQSLAESVELTEGLVERVDGYLDYMVEQWMENNEIALERGIKADLFESFMSGMKGLFEEHMINVPAEELHVLSEQQSVIEELESKIDRVLAENVALKRDIKAIAKQEQIMEAASGLSELEAERFMILAEELSFDNEDIFGKKLGVIREQFFSEDSTQTLTESVITDSPVINEETVVRKPQADSRVAAYANALSRTTI